MPIDQHGIQLDDLEPGCSYIVTWEVDSEGGWFEAKFIGWQVRQLRFERGTVYYFLDPRAVETIEQVLEVDSP